MELTDRFKYNPTLFSSKKGAITGYPGPKNSTLSLKSSPGPNGYKKRRRSTRKHKSKKVKSKRVRFKKI